jgi:hypothetical protein
MAGNIFPFTIFFPLAEVSTAAHSTPASHRATRLFADSFGRSNPHSDALLFLMIHHHWARASVSTAHPADDLHR